MQLPLTTAGSERAAAVLETVILIALTALCLHLFRRYRKPYFAWFAAAWGLYVLRMAAILSFLSTADRAWLYWHQVFTGWTALALLWAALSFARQLRWRPVYIAVALFPPVWSYIAIYVLQHFLWAAGPAVAFLSLATLATGWVFYRHGAKVGGAGAGLLAGAFVLWGIHHLDYVFLRARGAWNPWGYYLDICFELAVGAGVLVLVLDDLRRGLGALVSLSGDLQHAGRNEDVLSTLLERPLTLPAVRGSALFLRIEGTVRLERGAGAAATWAGVPTPELRTALERAFASSRPQVAMARDGGLPGHAFEAVLPVFRGTEVTGALVITGDARDPFAALDENYLVTLGQQVGAALENADLTRRLHTRTVELARLSARMVEQHEDERRRLSRELHDETAQVFSAVKMELGVLRDRVAPADSTRLDHVLSLVDKGIRSIRSVVHSLRPSLLDDLGLIPALRSLTTDFGGRSTFAVRLDAPRTLPPLSKDAELALFRALQEALANVARHAAGATAVKVVVSVEAGSLELRVEDNGRGLPPGVTPATVERPGHMGITGMRERIGTLGGSVSLESASGGGVRLRVRVPLAGPPSP